MLLRSPVRQAPYICSSCLRALGTRRVVIATHQRPKAQIADLSSSASRRHPQQSIRIIRDVADLRAFRNVLRKHQLTQGRGSLGLVPTLGALHEGHLELARRAVAENDEVVVSIYLNPTQFGLNEDLASYPQTWESDMSKLQSLNESLSSSSSRGRITAVFAPTTSTMYPTLPPSSEPDGAGSFVTITPLGNRLEGASRPVFFRGVATVCMKLFNLVQADRVYFGQKDAQQAALIKRMVRDFHVDTEVVVCPTVRDHDGLALSSRNAYLGERRRKASVALIRMLRSVEGRYKKEAMRTRSALLDPYARMAGVVQKRAAGVAGQEVRYVVDYVSLADPDTMEEVDMVDPERGALLSSAMLMLPVEEEEEEEHDVMKPGEEDAGPAAAAAAAAAAAQKGVQRTVRLIDNLILPPLRQK